MTVCLPDEIPVRRADLEALFRDGAGNLVPPSGRSGQTTSQTNRVYALQRLYALVACCGACGKTRAQAAGGTFCDGIGPHCFPEVPK